MRARALPMWSVGFSGDQTVTRLLIRHTTQAPAAIISVPAQPIPLSHWLGPVGGSVSGGVGGAGLVGVTAMVVLVVGSSGTVVESGRVDGGAVLLEVVTRLVELLDDDELGTDDEDAGSVDDVVDVQLHGTVVLVVVLDVQSHGRVVSVVGSVVCVDGAVLVVATVVTVVDEGSVEGTVVTVVDGTVLTVELDSVDGAVLLLDCGTDELLDAGQVLLGTELLDDEDAGRLELELLEPCGRVVVSSHVVVVSMELELELELLG